MFDHTELLADCHEKLAAERRMQAGHQKRGRNSLPRYIGDGDGDMRGAELNEVIVIAADRTRGLANGLNLDTRSRWQSAREKLVLHFASDGNFILQASALVFHFDELAN